MHPHNETVVLKNHSTNYSLSCNAAGALSYYWEKRNSNIPSNIIGIYTNVITIINLQLSNAGFYRCVATNDSGSSKSYYAELVINDGKLCILLLCCIIIYVKVSEFIRMFEIDKSLAVFIMCSV